MISETSCPTDAFGVRLSASDQPAPEPAAAKAKTKAVAPPLPRSMAHCLRCGFQWFTRVEHPVRCPNCASKQWDTPRPVKAQSDPGKRRGGSFNSETAARASAKAAAARRAKAQQQGNASDAADP